jgi:hypothetical protein
MFERAFKGKDKFVVNDTILRKPIKRLNKSYSLEPALNL